MKTRTYIVAGVVLGCGVIAGIVFGHVRQSQQYPSLNPYRVVQREEKIHDDGRVEQTLILEIFTTSDGTIRQIHNTLNSDGNGRGVFEQILSPSLGGILIYPQKNTYQRFHEPTGPQPRLTSHQMMALDGYDRMEALPNGFTAYVRKGTDGGSDYELWYCPELGNVVVGRMERPRRAGYKIIRRTLSIEPSKESDAQVDLTKFRRLDDLTLGSEQ